MRRVLAQSWKNLFRLLARELQIKRVRTEMEVTRPLKCAELRGSHVFENSVALSSLEHTATGNIAKIDNAGNPVIKTEGQFVFFNPV